MLTIPQSLEQVQALTNKAMATTEQNAKTLTGQVNALIKGYGKLMIKYPEIYTELTGGTSEDGSPATGMIYPGQDWARPDAFPNLGLVDMSDFEGVYATYHVDYDDSNFLSIYGGSALVIEEVAIDEDGNVTVLQTCQPTIASSIARLDLSEFTEGYHVFRVTGFTAAWHFETSHTINSTTLQAIQQRCVELYARFPSITCAYSSGQRLGTVWLRHAKWLDTAIALNNTESSTGSYASSAMLQSIETDNCTWGGNGFAYTFQNCTSLTALDTSGWDTSNVTTLAYAFQNCTALTALDTSSWNISNVTTFAYAFSGCSGLIALGASGWNTSKVTTFNYAFQNCTSLATLDTSNWDTSKVTSFNCAFYNCASLTALDTSSWDTSKVTTFSYAFSGCVNLTTLDTSGWETSSATTLSCIFQNCTSLTALDTSNWDTSKVTSFSYAFQNCASLTALDSSGWDTSNVTTFAYAFSGCTALTALDTSGWDCAKCTNVTSMFLSCSNLIHLVMGTVYISFSISSSTLYAISTLVAILEALPEVTSTQTLTMGTTNTAKLTSEQIAIAAAKGWTVA